MRGLVGWCGVHGRKPSLALAAWVLATCIGVSLALASAHGLHGARNGGGATATVAPDDASPARIEQDNRNGHNGVEQARGELSRAQVVALARRRYRARVVRAHRFQPPGGRPSYELRLLSPQGMVWTVRIDALSGEEIR